MLLSVDRFRLSTPVPRTLLCAAIVLWALAVSGGFYWITDHDVRPAVVGQPPEIWPASSRLQRFATGWTLVAFLHPRCPCSRASVAELARVARSCEGRARMHVMFLQPSSRDEAWSRTSLWDDAAQIANADIRIDRGGEEARRFGALISGQTCLYDAAGRLVFHGGVTAARGHYGANSSSDRLIALILGTEQRPRETDTYGCPLNEADDRVNEGRP